MNQVHSPHMELKIPNRISVFNCRNSVFFGRPIFQIPMSLSMCEFSNIAISVRLADRTNGRAYATVLRLSVVCRLSVCDVMYCG